MPVTPNPDFDGLRTESIASLDNLRQAFRDNYRKLLAVAVHADPNYCWPDKSPAAVARCVDRMTAKICEGWPADFYRYNPVIRRAGGALGFNTSKQLREALGNPID